MAKEHGLAGLFDDKGSVRSRPVAAAKAEDDLPPVLDDADKSPLDLLADKIGLEPVGFDTPPAPGRGETAPEPAELKTPPPPRPHEDDDELPVSNPFGQFDDDAASDEEPPLAEDEPFAAPGSEAQEGILCFLLEGMDGRGRRRTLEALNVAAGNGLVRLRTLPDDPDQMDRVLREALSENECAYVTFLHWGTEPADDWATEVATAFEHAPRIAAVSVRAANSDPLSPWSRVSFFMDEVERQSGIATGVDTTVFRAGALRELGGSLGSTIRNGNLMAALLGRGHRVGTASEARVSLLTPSKRREVLDHVREQARVAARMRARDRGPVARYLSAAGIMLGYPFRVLAVRAAAKRSLGGTQFREVASKAAMAILIDRRVRALTMLNPGKPRR